MEEWFLSEFGQYGFMISPTLYDPFSFSPVKKITHPHYPSNIYLNLVPELTNDVHGFGEGPNFYINEYREMFKDELERRFGDVLNRGIDFKPIRKSFIFKFI